MADQHNWSFFGQKIAMFMNSSSMTDPKTWLRMIRKNEQTQVWEKPSANEGIVVSINLTELASIMDVLAHLEEEWSTVHTWQAKTGAKSSTSISFKWDKEHKGIWINIGTYGKNLKDGELRLFDKLLTHLFNEKVEFATHGKKQTVNSG